MLEQNEIQFPHLGIDLHVDSTAFQIFGIDIQWYGLLITCGLLLAMIYAFHNMRSYGIHPDRAIDAIIGGIIGAIVGARAYYVILEWDNYAGDWKRIFNLRQGGLAIYGGLIGALVVGCITERSYSMHTRSESRRRAKLEPIKLWNFRERSKAVELK